MTPKPIEQARDSDLRLSLVALQRAARRAHEIAEQTGTAIVISRDGVLEYHQPKSEFPVLTVQQPSRPYNEK